MKRSRTMQMRSRDEIPAELKKSLIELFTAFHQSRSGFLNPANAFRNRKLRIEKVNHVNETIDYIRDFEGTSSQLIEWLKDRKRTHAQLSRDHHKDHYNLDGRNMKKVTWETPPNTQIYVVGGQPIVIHNPAQKHTAIVPDVKDKQLSNKSELAEAYHNAIDMISNYRVACQLRNT